MSWSSSFAWWMASEWFVPAVALPAAASFIAAVAAWQELRGKRMRGLIMQGLTINLAVILAHVYVLWPAGIADAGDIRLVPTVLLAIIALAFRRESLPSPAAAFAAAWLVTAIPDLAGALLYALQAGSPIEGFMVFVGGDGWADGLLRTPVLTALVAAAFQFEQRLKGQKNVLPVT